MAQESSPPAMALQPSPAVGGPAPVNATVSSSNSETDTEKTTPITKEGKETLHAYFSQLRWPRNHRMPKINTDGALDAIINKFGLKRSQASRQLRVWKDKQYCYAQVKIVIDPEEVEISIMEGLSMELDEYVGEFFTILNEGRVVPGSVDATNYVKSIETLENAEAKIWLVDFIHKNPQQFNALFVFLIKRWNRHASQAFPECAKNMSVRRDPVELTSNFRQNSKYCTEQNSTRCSILEEAKLLCITSFVNA